MLHINFDSIKDKSFTVSAALADNNIYKCIGYGQNPSSGADYIVGTVSDAATGNSTIKTFLLKQVTFLSVL